MCCSLLQSLSVCILQVLFSLLLSTHFCHLSAETRKKDTPKSKAWLKGDLSTLRTHVSRYAKFSYNPFPILTLTVQISLCAVSRDLCYSKNWAESSRAKGLETWWQVSSTQPEKLTNLSGFVLGHNSQLPDSQLSPRSRLQSRKRAWRSFFSNLWLTQIW